MFVRIFSVLLSLTLVTLHAQTPENEIIVQLNNEHALLPIYIAPPQISNSNLDKDYLEKVQGVLLFDMNHNGMTKVAPASTEKTEWARLARIKSSEENWKNQGIFYVIDLVAEGNQLKSYITSINSGETFQGSPVALSGDLAQDRRAVHILADSIHKLLFGRAGIASTRILYTVSSPQSTNARPLSDVWIADYDGANAQQVTRENSLCVTPSFIPAQANYRSGNFLYVSYRYGQPKIFLGTVQGQEFGQKLTNIRGNQLMPQSSLQRDKVAFVCDAAGNPDLFLQRFDPAMGTIGKPQQIFAAPHAAQASPAFSPDGSKVAFVSNKDGRPRIYVIDISNSEFSYNKRPDAQLISKESRENTSPSWSPDGTMIAYSAKTLGTRQIWLYDLRSGTERQLTRGPGNKENPTWAPDSLHLMFNSADQGYSELYLINLHESTATQVTKGPGVKRFPSWEPTQ